MKKFEAAVAFCLQQEAALAVLVLSGLACVRASAQDLFETRVQGAAVAADRTADAVSTESVTARDRHAGDTADVLARMPGVYTQRTGGWGAPAVVSIRGVTPQQVPVYLDDIPLGGAALLSVDLSEIPVTFLGGITVYRGTVLTGPWAGGIGGAISLHTAPIPENGLRAAASLGTLGTYRLTVLDGRRLGAVSQLLLGYASGSRGDYPYWNDAGTLHNPDDDGVRRREHNRSAAQGGLFKWRFRAGRWNLDATVLLAGRRRQLPGWGAVTAQRAAHRSAQQGLGIRGERQAARWTWRWAAWWWHNGRDFRDPFDEIGVGRQVLDDDIVRAGARLGCSVRWTRRNRSEVSVEGRAEHYASAEKVTGATTTYFRTAPAVTATHAWRAHPTAEIQGRWTGMWQVSAHDGVRDRIFAPSTALGWWWQLHPHLRLRAAAGKYTRIPGFVELFGDAATVAGNPALRPEQGRNAQAGWTWRRTAPFRALRSVRWETTVFGSLVDDMIVFVQNTQNTVRAENVDAAVAAGAETGVRLALGAGGTAWSNYTWLRAINRSDAPYLAGRHLPGKPEHQAQWGMSRTWWLRAWRQHVWWEARLQGKNYLDQANFRSVSVARWEVDAGVQWEYAPWAMRIGLVVRNAMNRFAVATSSGVHPVQDVYGYPLPGRTVFVTMSWHEEDP